MVSCTVSCSNHPESECEAVKDEPRSEIHRLHLRLFGCKVYAEAQIQRFSTASGQAPWQLGTGVTMGRKIMSILSLKNILPYLK